MELLDRIQFITGDLTAERVDAIVNAANSDLILGGGVAGAIRRAGGSSIQEECDAHGPLQVGQAALTGGGDLPAEHVIHAAVMRLGSVPSAQSIGDATLNALRIASEQGFHTISFPALGTGIGGFPMERSAEIMLETTLEFLKIHTYPQRVRFVLFDAAAAAIFSAVWKQMHN